VFPVKDEQITVEAFSIPREFARINGLDFRLGSSVRRGILRLGS
jgi:hypothetical protein